jgi:nucleoid-associated protein YgaU
MQPNLLSGTTEFVPAAKYENLQQKVRELEAALARAALNPASPLESVSIESRIQSQPTGAHRGPAEIDQEREAKPKSATPDTVVRHTVQAGESLYTIARSRYGSQAGHVVDAIFQANRNQLEHPDRIQAGMVLDLPKLQDAPSTQVRHAADRSTKVPGEPRNSNKRSEEFVWYQVRKNDRYASIARTLLGDELRWQEIYKLNKDTFPHPDRIREGVRIKVPRHFGQ